MHYYLIKQQDESDCGAACISTIARFYGKRISISKIRTIAGTDTKGTNLAGIIQGAKKIGFSAHALKGDKSLSIKNDYKEEYVAPRDEIETAFIMGDGTSYIKAGTEWIAKSVFVLDTFHLEKYINNLNYDEYLKTKLQEAIEQFDPISTESIMEEAIKKINKEIQENKELERSTKSLENRLKKIKETKTYLMNQWSGIEAHDKYKDTLTGCCQEGQVHHTLSERMSTDAKVWCEDGINEMSQ